MEEKNTDREKLEALQLQSKQMRKKLLLVLGSILLVAAVLFVTILLIDGPRGDEKQNHSTIEEYKDSDFYAPYKGDIMSNKEYLNLDRKVYYADGSGMETSIEDNNLTTFNREVLFLYAYLQTIIAGDSETYNSYFNDTYYQTNAPKGSFNPQMIYGAKITFDKRTNDGNDILITYKLEYMIHRNDGTFRRDILSDASLPQYITLRNSVEGGLLIEKIVTHYSVIETPNS